MSPREGLPPPENSGTPSVKNPVFKRRSSEHSFGELTYGISPRWAGGGAGRARFALGATPPPRCVEAGRSLPSTATAAHAPKRHSHREPAASSLGGQPSFADARSARKSTSSTENSTGT